MGLKKNRSRRTTTQLLKENDFVANMKSLFDVAHTDALTLITIQEDRDFLLAQREPGHRGYMGCVDQALVNLEARKAKRFEVAEKRRQSAQVDKEIGIK